MRSVVASCLLAMALSGAFAGGASAQVAVLPVTDLRFGELMAGIPTRVPPTDGARRAELEVTVKGRVTVVMVLPAQLSTAGSKTIPVQFAANDGLYQVGTGPLQSFDPRSPLTVVVPGSTGRLRLYIGGTAVTSPAQAPGTYAASISAQATKGGA